MVSFFGIFKGKGFFEPSFSLLCDFKARLPVPHPPSSQPGLESSQGVGWWAGAGSRLVCEGEGWGRDWH